MRKEGVSGHENDNSVVNEEGNGRNNNGTDRKKDTNEEEQANLEGIVQANSKQGDGIESIDRQNITA